MSTRSSLGNGLLRAIVSLGLGCLVAQGTLSSQAATAKPSFEASRSASLSQANVAPPSALLAGSTCQCDALLNGLDSILTAQVQTVLTDDGVTLEDSIEMLHVDAQRRSFVIEQVTIGPKGASKGARKTSTPRPLLE